MTEKLVLGVRVGGKNGPRLVLTGETKEEVVALIRTFATGTTGADLVLTVNGPRGEDDVILQASDGCLAWKTHRKNHIYLGKDVNRVETFDFPFQAVNEFCVLAYHEGAWADDVLF